MYRALLSSPMPPAFYSIYLGVDFSRSVCSFLFSFHFLFNNEWKTAAALAIIITFLHFSKYTNTHTRLRRSSSCSSTAKLANAVERKPWTDELYFLFRILTMMTVMIIIIVMSGKGGGGAVPCTRSMYLKKKMILFFGSRLSFSRSTLAFPLCLSFSVCVCVCGCGRVSIPLAPTHSFSTNLFFQIYSNLYCICHYNCRSIIWMAVSTILRSVRKRKKSRRKNKINLITLLRHFAFLTAASPV